MQNLLLFLAVLAGWILLQYVVLPKLGIRT
jgi:hypothetical protein